MSLQTKSTKARITDAIHFQRKSISRTFEVGTFPELVSLFEELAGL